MDIQHIHGEVHAIGGYLPMRWAEYDHEMVPFSMEYHYIHGRNILSIDLDTPWGQCSRHAYC